MDDPEQCGRKTGINPEKEFEAADYADDADSGGICVFSMGDLHLHALRTD